MGSNNAMLIKSEVNFNSSAIVKDHCCILKWEFKPRFLSEFETIILLGRGRK
jgi:hypothetical protein